MNLNNFILKFINGIKKDYFYFDITIFVLNKLIDEGIFNKN